jgi:hypothetical protein
VGRRERRKNLATWIPLSPGWTALDNDDRDIVVTHDGTLVHWDQAGLVPVYAGQRDGMADRRVVDMQGRTVVCKGDRVTQNYFVFRVALAPTAG